jgi:hypothetical protein
MEKSFREFDPNNFFEKEFEINGMYCVTLSRNKLKELNIPLPATSIFIRYLGNQNFKCYHYGGRTIKLEKENVLRRTYKR